MQDCYVGDAGDFGKYGLLRALCSPREDDLKTLSLGIIWYLVSTNRATTAERSDTWTRISRRRQTTGSATRSWTHLCMTHSAASFSLATGTTAHSRKRILPSDTTVFYEEPLTFEGIEDVMRGEWRKQWLQGALDLTEGCEVYLSTQIMGSRSSPFPHREERPKVRLLR